MTSPDLGRVRRAIDIFHTGHVGVMRSMFAPDIRWRVPRSHPLAADIVGIDNVLAFLGRVHEETGGTFCAQTLDLAANGSCIFCLMQVRASRGGRTLDQRAVCLWRVRERDGKLCERELFLSDQLSADEFWSF